LGKGEAESTTQALLNNNRSLRTVLGSDQQ